MKIDGFGPLSGPLKNTPSGKKSPKEEGKSFGEILAKKNPDIISTNSPISKKTPPESPSKEKLGSETNFSHPDALPNEAATQDISLSAHSLQNLDGEKPVKETSKSSQDYLEKVKSRLNSGYYQTKKVSEAISDKLTGIFDELA